MQWVALEVSDGLIGFVFERHPITLIGSLAVNFSRKQNAGGSLIYRNEHVRRTEISEIDRAVAQALKDNGSRKRDNYLHRPAKLVREVFRQLRALRYHGIGIFVRLQRHDDLRQSGRGGRRHLRNDPDQGEQSYQRVGEEFHTRPTPTET